jgi:hypothetical protein
MQNVSMYRRQLVDSKPVNPYYDLNAVVDAHMFFGRKNVLRRLYSAIAHRQCVSLVGSRHIGKSSVLKWMCYPLIQQQFQEDLSRHILILLDLREYRKMNEEDFFAAVSRLIASHCRKHLELVVDEGTGADGFSDLLDQVNEHGYYPVLLMDAFDNITRNQNFDLEFFAFLRSQSGKVSYVTASIAPLAEVCHRDIQESPFFNIFGLCEIGPLTPEEAHDLIIIPAKRAGLPFRTEEADWILTLTGYHPFFIQRTCSYFFDEKCEHGEKGINKKRIASKVYAELQQHFEDTWERLSYAQQELVKNEAQQKGIHARALPELSDSLLWRQFVRKKCHLPFFQMEPKALEKVLGKINNLKALGESDLKHLKIVTIRTKNGDALSPVERGRAVREVLHEAFERLRGNGIRSDSEEEWRLYNILYYRYFKHRLKNEQISSRLGFGSIRQYYRERTKAIEIMLNTLLEMEAAANTNEDA